MTAKQKAAIRDELMKLSKISEARGLGHWEHPIYVTPYLERIIAIVEGE